MQNDRIGPPDQAEAILIAYDYDARAAVTDLVADLDRLHTRLALADRAMSSGLVRGWRVIEYGRTGNA